MATLNLRDVPDHIHDALRSEAAGRKISIKGLMIQVVEEWLQREAKWAERPRTRPATAARRRGGRA